MRWNERAATACYLVVTALLLGHAVVYLTRTEFLPYHAGAVGVEWNELPREMQALLLALIRATGGGSLAVGAALLAMLWFAFRQGKRWSYWTIPVVAAIQTGILLWVSHAVAVGTPGEPPWQLVAGALALVAAGAGLSVVRTS